MQPWLVVGVKEQCVPSGTLGTSRIVEHDDLQSRDCQGLG